MLDGYAGINRRINLALHKYGYSSGNPVNSSDRSGLKDSLACHPAFGDGGDCGGGGGWGGYYFIPGGGIGSTTGSSVLDALGAWEEQLIESGFGGAYLYQAADGSLRFTMDPYGITNDTCAANPVACQSGISVGFAHNETGTFITMDAQMEGPRLAANGDLLDQLNPFNLNGSLAQSGMSISDAVTGLAEGDLAKVTAAGATNPLGQTENGPAAAYYGTRGALAVSGAAAGMAVLTGAAEAGLFPSLLGPRGALFGRGGSGILNNNDVLRWGWGWNQQIGQQIMRMSIGGPRWPVWWHLPW